MTEDTYPSTTQVVCANVILDERGVLLVRETKPSALGRWSLPGGRLESGESLRRCAGREALEETGLTVDVGPLLGIYHCPATLEGGSADAMSSWQSPPRTRDLSFPRTWSPR